MKTCRRCKQEKPIESFPLSQVGKDGKRHGDGYRAVCKACDNAYARDRRRKMSRSERSKLRKYHADYCRQYRKAKPWTGKERTANTRAKQLGIPSRLTKDDVLRVWHKWNGCCWVCGDVAEELDHFRPINRGGGGTNTKDNIRPICRDCNHKRSHYWHGKDIAQQEVHLLRQLKELLRERA